MKNSATTVEMVARRVKLFKGGRNSEYSTFIIPKDLSDKYSLNQPCIIEIIDCEEKGGFLIKKVS